MDKCKGCDMIATQHWFPAGTTFKINCNIENAYACWKQVRDCRRGPSGTPGNDPLLPEKVEK